LEEDSGPDSAKERTRNPVTNRVLSLGKLQPLHRYLAAFAVTAALALPAAAAAQDQVVHKDHAIAMHGEPKYGPDFEHFDYVNPEAPKGGEMHFGAEGTFDSFNPWIAKARRFHPGATPCW